MAKQNTIKRNDTQITFSDIPKKNGAYIPFADLAGSTLSFILKQQGGSVFIKKIAQIVPETIDSVQVAKFQYSPVAQDVERMGTYRQEWEVLDVDNKPLTFPNNGLPPYNEVKIVADLG